jgi:hypothetical protein
VNNRLKAQWVAVLVLGCIAYVAFTKHSPFEFVGIAAGAVCALFILDCVETAKGRTLNLFRFGLVVCAIIEILSLVRVPEIASFPVALIVGWKFEDFLLRYRAVKAIRELNKGKGSEEILNK